MSIKLVVSAKGSSKSGNYGHAGIPGHLGGSSSKSRSAAAGAGWQQQLMAKHSDVIESISDERDTEDGIWIYLKDGYEWSGDSTIHTDTVPQLKARLREVVKSQ